MRLIAKHKSPFTDWVADAWNELVLENRAKLTPEKQRNGWKALHDKTFVNGAWVVPIADAELVAGSGAMTYLCFGDFPLAREYLREFMIHPELDLESPNVGQEILIARLGIVEILCGNLEEGIEQIRAVLSRPSARQGIIHSIRHDLHGVATDGRLNPVADPRFAAFVAEVVGRYSRSKRWAQLAAKAETRAELADCLIATFGKSPCPQRTPGGVIEGNPGS